MKVGRDLWLFHLASQWCHKNPPSFDFFYLVFIITTSYKDCLCHSNKRPVQPDLYVSLSKAKAILLSSKSVRKPFIFIKLYRFNLMCITPNFYLHSLMSTSLSIKNLQPSWFDFYVIEFPQKFFHNLCGCDHF